MFCRDHCIKGREILFWVVIFFSLFTWELNDILLTLIGRQYIATNDKMLREDIKISNFLFLKINDKVENIMMNDMI